MIPIISNFKSNRLIIFIGGQNVVGNTGEPLFVFINAVWIFKFRYLAGDSNGIFQPMFFYGKIQG